MRLARSIALRATCAALLAGQVATVAAQAIAPQVQATRDDERLRILRDELALEQAVAREAATRQAERQAARDPRGANDAQAAHGRATHNIAALKREITSAEQTASTAPSQRASTDRARPAVAPAWWDVYARRASAPMTAPTTANATSTRP